MRTEINHEVTGSPLSRDFTTVTCAHFFAAELAMIIFIF